MRVAILTTDNREYFRDFENPIPYFGTAPEALLQGFAQLPEVEVHVISCARQHLAAPEKLGSNIFFHSLFVPKIGWLRTGYQGCIRAVRKKLKTIQPDIVHGQGTEKDCAISAVFSGFPSVVTIHGNMRLVARVTHAPPFSYTWLMGQLERVTLPRARGVVCITRYTQDAVQGLARKTWLIPNAADGSYFDITPNRESPPVILCVGTICPRKNQNAFIESLDELATRKPLQVIFLGTTAEGDPYCDTFFALLKERPWCQYDGFADHEKLKSYYARATIAALPSIEDNCPMVVLEAMAANVAVAAASVGGVPDLVENGKTGILFDPRSKSDMATAITRLIENGDREKLAAAAHEQACKRFRPSIIAAGHIEVYKEVLQTFS